MASKGLHHNVKQYIAFNGATINTDTTTNGNVIDTQFFYGVEFFFQVNARVAGTVTLNVQESDTTTSGDFTDVAPQFLLGSEENTALSTANSSARIGYVGQKRYVRIQVISTSSANLYASALAVLSYPSHAPTDTTLTDE